MKKMMLALFVTVALTGCMKRDLVCEKPATLHPVVACEDCHWQEN